MLTVLLIVFMFSQGLSMDNSGTDFITAIPENVAYYFYKTQHHLRITSLYPSTAVEITYVGEVERNLSTTMNFDNAGVTKTWNLSKEVEEYRFTSSNKSIVLSSTKDITVLSVSGSPGRFQSHVVQPVENLGTVYHIPTLRFTDLMTSFNLLLYSEPRFNSFRLLIINAVSRTNTVTIKQANSKHETALDPHHIFQIKSDGDVTEISATDKIAVMLTHPCFETKNCSCNMVMNQLLPAKLNTKPDRFPIPLSSAIETKQLFLTTDQSVKVVDGTFESGGGVEVTSSSDILPLLPNFNKETQLISTSVQVPLRLISSGLILELIPESMFSGCYLVHFGTFVSWAIVIAETSSTSSVKMNSADLPADSTQWSPVTGSQFSWAKVSGQGPATIWHPNSKIAVYVIEKLESENIFGRPAIIIGSEPDANGCVVSPGIYYVGNDELTWFMALQFCISNSDHFASILNKQNQDRLVANTSLPEPIDGWIGLRRDIYTREWYWKNEDTASPSLAVTYWADGEPDVPERGLCASASLDPAKNFTWKSARCCSTKKPICYKKPVYLTNLT